jgi:hypothetical protein
MRLGGTVSYAGRTAAALGRSVGIVTSAGPEVDLSPLEACATMIRHPAPQTTAFENVYTEEGDRSQFAYALAHPLGVADLPAAWQDVPLVHIGPIMDECNPALVEHFAGRAFVGLTPQGWMRTRDSEGRVRSQRWATAERLLPLASAVVLSLEDVGGDWEVIQAYARQTAILVVTRGWLGGTLFLEGVAQTFPAFGGGDQCHRGRRYFRRRVFRGADARDAFSGGRGLRGVHRGGFRSARGADLGAQPFSHRGLF